MKYRSRFYLYSTVFLLTLILFFAHAYSNSFNQHSFHSNLKINFSHIQEPVSSESIPISSSNSVDWEEVDLEDGESDWISPNLIAIKPKGFSCFCLQINNFHLSRSSNLLLRPPRV